MTLDVGHGTRTGAEIVVDFLVAAGVRHVFGIVSIHNMPIVDAISRTDGIELNVHNMVPIQGVVPAPGRGAATEGR